MNKYFKESAFELTATPDAAQAWCGQASVRTRILRLCRGLKTNQASSIELVWASLGAGKTHTLLHMQALLTPGSADAVPVFFELPDQPKSFLDFYRRLIDAMPMDEIAKYIDATPKVRHQDLRKAARVILHGTDVERAQALDWLAAGHVNLRDLRSLTGIGSRIEREDDALRILGASMDALAANGKRLVLLVDEFQRIASANPRHRAGILACLRTLFNAHPSRLTAVVAVASKAEVSARELLSGELSTLIGARPLISLPEMDKVEAVTFLRERLIAFRPAGYIGDAVAPFSEKALETIAEGVAEMGDKRLIPRPLIQALGILYERLEEAPGGDPGKLAKKLFAEGESAWE